MDSPEAQRGDAGAVVEQISEEIAAIHEESYGRRPAKVTTYLLEDAVLCLCEIELLPYEALILETGDDATILRMRKAFQETIEPTFVSTVEHMTGRRVVAFISDTSLDPPFALEFFKLRPEGG
jgi:uncharacterized protein YbcI